LLRSIPHRRDDLFSIPAQRLDGRFRQVDARFRQRARILLAAYLVVEPQ
jgi:hypothetical protein